MSGSKNSIIASLDLGFELISRVSDPESSSETLMILEVKIGFGIGSIS